MHRYRNKRQGKQYEPLFDLLDEAGQKQAEVLGKAMRVGAMLMVSKDGDIGSFKWHPRKKQLRLTLPKSAEPLYGEVAEARLQALAQSLDAAVTVEIKD